MHSLAEAAKAVGKSKSTILRAVRSGKLSASKDAHGQYRIAPAELHRVYPPASDGAVREAVNEPIRTTHEAADEAANLRVELAATKQLADDRQRTIEDLRQRLDTEAAERREKDRQLTALLTDQRAAPEPPRGFWARLRGRKP